MESLQDTGAAPMEILIGAGRRSAETYGLSQDIGTVEAGKVVIL